MSSKKTQEKSKGPLIFMFALLVVYTVITIAMIVLFEFYTVSTSGGEIIFSLSMSWQIILFAIELATIILQIIYLIRLIKNKDVMHCNIIRYAGNLAVAAAFIAVVFLVYTQGFVVNPTVVFLIYAVIIAIVRRGVLPLVADRYISS